MANGKFRLLEAFRKTFAGTLYKHRNSTLGNKIGRELFEDLLAHELLILSLRATNQPPYPFSWLDTKQTELYYGAALTRVAELYQQRFR